MKLTLTNLHPSLRPPPGKWRRIVRCLLKPVLKENRFSRFSIAHLNIVWVDDARMAKLHWQYSHTKGPTDILTFDHGKGCAEIIISLDTASRQARRYKQTFSQELTLYLAHGILHLAGLGDKSQTERRKMRREEQLLIQKLNHEARRKY